MGKNGQNWPCLYSIPQNNHFSDDWAIGREGQGGMLGVRWVVRWVFRRGGSRVFRIDGGGLRGW